MCEEKIYVLTLRNVTQPKYDKTTRYITAADSAFVSSILTITHFSGYAPRSIAFFHPILPLIPAKES